MEITKRGFVNERLGVCLDVYKIGGKEWFRAKDVSSFIGYKNTNDMTKYISEQEENLITINSRTENGNNSNMVLIDEFGLYECILKVRKTDDGKYSKAREFQKWVFSEVLPSIRKNGAYIDKDHITKEQYERLKDTLLLFCENGKIGLPTASEKIFGDKKELNKRLILAGKIDRDSCWYDKDWHCTDGDKKYPIFVCDTKGRYTNGEVDNTLQVSLTNHGFVYLREFFNKHPNANESQGRLF